MQDNVIDGLVTAVAHPVTVQVINQGQGIWGNVATGLITAGAAITAVILTHRYTLRREKQAAEQKLKREQLFIATELILMLEQYAEECTQVAIDGGWNVAPVQSEAEPYADYPELNLADVSGDWRVLDLRHMYRIRELPVLQHEARRVIAFTREIPAPPNHESYFRERQYQFSRLGLKAVIMAERLRRVASLPGTRLADGEWSAVYRLRKVWRRERRRRAAEAVTNMQWHEPELPVKDNREEPTP
ncbi:hypothetical protein GL381_07840 [Salmonella enterica]|uniref:Uncharacterized protein n=1 Tax=Salmonella enterica TaxID=28901 RepID=A0A5Y2ZZD7_SALER|nr:hypothetical protein [Salmonella enterica]EAS0937008.1 hypothetical protein [Salmonella enterica]EAT9249215.1 hypothetical protein [Salmonella enterica]EAV7951697.1 hypothetical protein [Salmonella enterica]EAV9263458.1 hypothetical protein [Salmonella enterica]